jgi:hypothetical protein
MSVGVKRVLQVYDHNRTSLSYALSQAGGIPEVILAEHEDLLHTLAMNLVKLNASYEGERCEQTAAGSSIKAG